MNDKKLPSFINPQRYVFVEDMKLGQCGSYTDYEELAFTDLDYGDTYEQLKRTIAYMCWVDTTYRYKEWTDEQYARRNEDVAKSSQDICDLVFYSTVHVLAAYIEVEDRAPTQREMDLMVECSAHMLSTVLPCGWVCRPDVDWSTYKTKEV